MPIQHVNNDILKAMHRATSREQITTTISKLLMVGRFFGQCPEIDGQVIINDARAVKAFGEVYKVKITDIADYDLVGAALA